VCGLRARLSGKVKIRWFPKMRVAFMPPQRLSIPPELRSRKRRAYAGQQLSKLMTEMMFESSDFRRTLFDSLLDASYTPMAACRPCSISPPVSATWSAVAARSH
jgi:hypothetical protein